MICAGSMVFTMSCTVEGTTGGQGAMSGQRSAPEAVLAMAGPNQDLSTAVLREADGCYWYTHRGPVETTQLPLRTRGGQAICNQSAVDAAAAAQAAG